MWLLDFRWWGIVVVASGLAFWGGYWWGSDNAKLSAEVVRLKKDVAIEQGNRKAAEDARDLLAKQAREAEAIAAARAKDLADAAQKEQTLQGTLDDYEQELANARADVGSCNAATAHDVDVMRSLSAGDPAARSGDGKATDRDPDVAVPAGPASVRPAPEGR